MKTLLFSIMLVSAGLTFPVQAQSNLLHLLNSNHAFNATPENFTEKQQAAFQSTKATQNLLATYMITELWDRFSDWLLFTKTIYSYNSENQLLEELSLGYHPIYNTYSDYYRISYTYADNSIAVISEINRSNNWELEGLDSIFFDVFGNEYSKLSYERVDNDWKLRNGYEILEQFDSSGKTLFATERYCVNGLWFNNRYLEFEYTGEELTKVFVFLWINDNWEMAGRMIDFSWHNQQNFELAHCVFQAWVDSQFVNLEKIILTYNSNGLMTEQLHLSWDGQKWVNYLKEVLIYDHRNNQTEWAFYLWDPSKIEWEVNTAIRSYYSYDNNYNIITTVNQMYDMGEWINETRFTYGYENITSIGKKNTVENIKLYPNPTSNVFNVELGGTSKANIQVFDLNGKLKIAKVTNGEALITLDASKLNPGMYVIKVTEGNKLFMQKLMVQ